MENHNQQNTPSDVQVYESEKFQFLDYEADLYVAYKTSKFLFFIDPTWVFPLNPATIITDQGSYEEDLENGFYWTTGIRFTF